jgi:hypothetical protein
LLPEISATGPTKPVVVKVRGNNLVEVVQLTTLWTAKDRCVVLYFPSFQSRPLVGDASDPEPFGLSRDECYDRRGAQCWCPSRRFIDEVMEFFSDNPLVSCDQSAG